MSLLPSGVVSGPTAYAVSNSLRFRASASAYLNRTQGTSTNQLIGTWSFWFKRGTLGTNQRLFEGHTASSDTGSGNIEFGADNCLYVGGWFTNWRITTQVFRDPSAWYHAVVTIDTTQATANNRIRIYVNGTEVTAFSTTNNPSQNSTFGLNNNSSVLQIGRRRNVSNNDLFFDGYLAEVNFIDGQALTPSSFGETDLSTGVWVPKKYTGTYGTNGYYLPFNNATSASTLAQDQSGNGNNWTPNNISVTPGVTYDAMTDSPTAISATVGNYCVMSPIDNGGNTLSNANLTLTSSVGTAPMTKGTIGVSSGKWYWEVTPTSLGSSSIGIAGATVPSSETVGTNPLSWGYLQDARKYNNTSATSYGSSYTTNDVIGVALDMDAGTLTYYKNNVSQGQAFSGITGTVLPALSDYSADPATVWQVNFGQRPFAYTPPTGFQRLNTFNLPTPTIGATPTTQANKYFDATTYSGNGGTQSITSLGFQPDLVWVKRRNAVASHNLVDAVRGASKILYSDATTAEITDTNDINAFNSNGWTMGLNTDVNASGGTYVGWTWRGANGTVTNTAGSITSTVSANTTAGFSIVTYTGTGVNATVGHGLGVAPRMIIVKPRSATVTTDSWNVYHASLGNTQFLVLNATDAATTASNRWNNTSPTSSVFSIGTVPSSNGVGYVAYCFAEVAGYSKFGSYTGNGSSDGPFVYTGFRPRYFMVKKSDSSGNDWILMDTARDPINVATQELYANLSNAEGTAANNYDILSNGFKARRSNVAVNASGGTYIYMAFAEFPQKFSLAR